MLVDFDVMRRLWLTTGLLSTLTACGPSRAYAPAWDGGQGIPPSDSSVPPPPPPEREEQRNFLQPRAGGRYVYVANPTRDSVAVIDSQTLAIESVEVGRRPEAVLTADGRDEAIVLNSGSNTASILRTTNGRTAVSTVPTFIGANAIALAPDGRHAVVYLDTSAGGASAGGSFQDIVVISLAPGMDRAVRLTVGFRPVDVRFSRDGASGFVVTEDGISILRFSALTGPMIVPNVSLADPTVDEIISDAGVDASTDASPLSDASEDADGAGGADGAADADVGVVGDAVADAGRVGNPDTNLVASDVSITPDGRYAIARSEGSGVLRLVDLNERTIRRIDVGGAVTDLDLSSDGSFAIAVLRDASQVLRVPVPQAFSDRDTIRRTELRGELFGSVSIAPDARRALLYTTALESRRLLVMDLAGTGGTVALALRKTVRSVAFAPDSRTALVLHRVSAGDPAESGISMQTMLDRSPGYSMVEPSARFVKLQLTRADVGPFAIVPSGTHAFLLQRLDARSIAAVDRVDLRSFVADSVTLGSPPLSVGSVPSSRRVFVGQEHPEGRISFIDWESGALQSVTGFELNARIVM
jgi:YVTN family beta-propeller protein